MNQELEPPSEGAVASLDQTRQSVSSDLQYISLQVDGKPYGGWYRLLPDGRMELLALANMHCERRAEKTPVEQARGMLVDFIRASRKGDGSAECTAPNPAADDDRSNGASTLGDLLFADKSQLRIPEDDWVGLIKAIAAGDPRALDALFVCAHDIVYTLIVRLTGKPDVAEELTLRVFQDVWREASHFDATGGPVLAWLSNQARLRAIERLELEAHLVACNECSSRLDALRPVVDSLALLWPADLLRPSATLRQRLAERIAAETGKEPIFSQTGWEDPAWEQAAPGITCKLLATDSENERVSMLVRLAPSAEYPPHTHAGREELHLLDGELWIDARKLYPGDYNRAESGSADHRVWSETGCLCLLITSTRDQLGQTA